MKVYIAGPMSGIAEHNFPAFFSAAASLRAAGYDVSNPAEVDQGPNPSWQHCMKNDIPQLLNCDAIVLLWGWEKSRGALLELHIATALEMPVLYIADLIRPAACGVSVERLDPARLAVADGDEADIRNFIESDFRIRSGTCPNGCGVMTENEHGQECPACQFSCNTPAEKGAAS